MGQDHCTHKLNEAVATYTRAAQFKPVTTPAWLGEGDLNTPPLPEDLLVVDGY